MKGIELEDNNISNCYYGIQLLGGPLEKFDIKDNVIDCSTGALALYVQADYIPCPPPFINTPRTSKGKIKDNTVHDALFGIVCQASTTLKNVQVKGNTFVNSGLFDVLLANSNAPPGFSGANGFTIKGNTFSGTADVADVYLGQATINNVIKVPVGTHVRAEMNASGMSMLPWLSQTFCETAPQECSRSSC